MEDIEINRADDNFNYTVSLCSTSLFKKNNDEILYDVYEEFDSYSWSFLHENTLNVLLTSGLINEEIFKLSFELRELSVKLFSSDIDRSVDELKRNENWKEVFSLCDRIIELKKGVIQG
ncbi:hypothetical protein [Fluviicola sp.]|uniref:hypothetical protein n=1 Tax=Fluviicola sp. TaxID=1917219 RepID=UPI002632D2EA|nr:hypothetical protein [Fluviicola sp.]